MEFFKVSILILVGIVALADVEAGGFCGNDVCSQNSCSRDTCSKATVLCCNDPCLEPIYSVSSCLNTTQMEANLI